MLFFQSTWNDDTDTCLTFFLTGDGDGPNFRQIFDDIGLA